MKNLFVKNQTKFKRILINFTKSDHIQTYSEISFPIQTRQKIYYFLTYFYQAVWDYYDLESLKKQKRESTSSGPTELSFLPHQTTIKVIISVCSIYYPSSIFLYTINLTSLLNSISWSHLHSKTSNKFPANQRPEDFNLIPKSLISHENCAYNRISLEA